MSEKGNNPISIDLGAKATLEVKTEIPSESSGRIVDALTDLIRPLSERRGLRADQIRLQREDVALEIAKKAMERRGIESLTFKPIPNKILVPLLEKGSLEEPGGPFVDWWANLLVAAGQEPGQVRPYFSELVSQLGADEAILLDALWSAFSSRVQFVFHPREFPNYIFNELREGIGKIVRRETALTDDAWYLETSFKLQSLAQDFVQSGPKFGAGFRLSWPDGGQRFAFASKVFFESGVSLDVCRALNLLTYDTVIEDFGVIGMQQNYEVGILRFSDLGVEFMRACRPPEK